MTRSQQLFAQAQALIPGGVNSPVRAFQAVEDTPRFIARAGGARLYDVDGNAYTDYVGSWGPMILGHNHPVVRAAVEEAIARGLSFGAATEAEVIMAQLVCELIPSIEMVRMVNSGTEAVMSAVRLARGFTGRRKIIKFAGCYHGHSDAMLVKAGSGAMTGGVPNSAGVPPGCVEDTLTATYNDVDSVERLFAANPQQVAGVIVEPVGANMGVVPPQEGFLAALRRLCDANGALLLFDEVITGFRLGLDGAQGYYGVVPDLTTFGKIIGAGMPVGAYGGRREIMARVAPCGDVYQAGTLSGNPVAMAAGIAQLTYLRQHPQVYEKINRLGESLRQGLRQLVERYQAPCCVTGAGSLGCLFFTPGPVRNYEEAAQAEVAAYGRYFRHMLERGIYLAPAQFEAFFLSDAHEEQDIADFLTAAGDFCRQEYGK